VKSYTFTAGPMPRGRVSVYEPPKRGTAGDLMDRYVIGHDSAYGLTDGDFDAAVVLSRNTGRQVAEAEGRWGDVRWAEVLAGLYWYYGEAFLLGERQVGLPTMRRLYDEMGCTYQFFDRDDATPGRRHSDKLGHHRRKGDLVIPRLRSAIAPHDEQMRRLPPTVRFVSPELIRQLKVYQWRPRTSGVRLKDAHDEDLQCGAPEGDHDDLAMAAAYSVMALGEVARFPEPVKPKYAAGSAGLLLDHDSMFAGKDDEDE
jgi:hypothetical protein